MTYPYANFTPDWIDGQTVHDVDVNLIETALNDVRAVLGDDPAVGFADVEAAMLGHTHTESDITDLAEYATVSDLDFKANLVHGHIASDLTGVRVPITASVPEDLIVQTYTTPILFHADMTDLTVRVRLGEAPTGASLIFQFLLNGTPGNDMFASDFTIPAGNLAAAETASTFDVASGEFALLEVTQVGSTNPGAQMVIVFSGEVF